MGAFHRKASCTSPVSALLLFRIPYPIWTPCVKCMIGSVLLLPRLWVGSHRVTLVSATFTSHSSLWKLGGGED